METNTTSYILQILSLGQLQICDGSISPFPEINYKFVLLQLISSIHFNTGNMDESHFFKNPVNLLKIGPT